MRRSPIVHAPVFRPTDRTLMEAEMAAMTGDPLDEIARHSDVLDAEDRVERELHNLHRVNRFGRGR